MFHLRGGPHSILISDHCHQLGFLRSPGVYFLALQRVALKNSHVEKLTMASRFFIIIALLYLKYSFAFVPNFSNYPPAAISCLNNAAITSGCNADSSTFDTSNACLCSNGGDFVTLAAQCIGSSAPGALSNTYSTMLSNCDTTNTALTVSSAAFLAAGQASGDSPTTTFPPSPTSISTPPPETLQTLQALKVSSMPSQSAATSAPTSSSSGASGGGKSKLSQSDTIALAVGIPATVFTIIGVFITCRRRNR